MTVKTLYRWSRPNSQNFGLPSVYKEMLQRERELSREYFDLAIYLLYCSPYKLNKALRYCFIVVYVISTFVTSAPGAQMNEFYRHKV